MSQASGSAIGQLSGQSIPLSLNVAIRGSDSFYGSVTKQWVWVVLFALCLGHVIRAGYGNNMPGLKIHGLRAQKILKRFILARPNEPNHNRGKKFISFSLSISTHLNGLGGFSADLF